MTSHVDDADRRDFLVVAANAFAGVGAASLLWPFIQQMNPDASTKALSSVEIDLSGIKEGQAITPMWRGKPIFVRRRTKDEIAAAQKVALADLPDKDSRNDAFPQDKPAEAIDSNRVKAGREEWLILVGVCTHLGCIPKGQTTAEMSLRGDYGGWFCPCHGSHYDTAGRIRKGPAPRNLEVPPYVFLSDTKIKIG